MARRIKSEFEQFMNEVLLHYFFFEQDGNPKQLEAACKLMDVAHETLKEKLCEVSNGSTLS